MNKIDVNTKTSQHIGAKGIVEKLLRNFQTLMHLILILPVYLVAASLLGLALVPGVSLFRFIDQ
ncbi:MAG: hypothetical protein KDD45_03845, partial [Bdellovibrionales bacterium]|nr:hypothetical protein [Bdellovibrionales bacterium]